MEKIIYQPIGYIRSPHKTREGSPIQPNGAKEFEGYIEVDQTLVEGLKDLDAFSHVIILYHLHLAKPAKLVCKPFMDDHEHGIFAIRGPNRPNPIGLSIVPLIKVEENKVWIKHVDMLDGTPVLDIKPYVTDFDCHPEATKGWLEHNVHKSKTMKADDRFIK